MATSRLIVASVLTGLAACGPDRLPPLDPARFSGQEAFHNVERLVALGPHPTGSPALAQAGDLIATSLRTAGWEVEEQVFHAGTPRGPLQFRNLVARAPGWQRARAPIVILGTHYDTKWFENIRFVGANDGGSGTGILMEFARACGPQPDVWLVFFDGEECVRDYGPEDGLWGSRFFVEELKSNPARDRVAAFVLLDMVGDADLHVTLPGNSNGELAAQVFAAAESLGWRDRFGYRPEEILDDHVPFLRAGIPAVDLIDFEYGSAPGRNDYWHTAADTVDKLSPTSLEIVGRTVVRLVDRRRPTEPKRP